MEETNRTHIGYKGSNYTYSWRPRYGNNSYIYVGIGKTSYFALNAYLHRNISSEWKASVSDWKNPISFLKNLICVWNSPISGLKKPPLPKVIFIDGDELLNSQVVHNVLS